MPTLSSSIVKRQVASMHDVEEALARQVVYGGDLATNLLELAAVDEARLLEIVAESQGLPKAPVGELPPASEAMRRLVPADLLARYGFCPLEEQDGTLRLAVVEPLPPEVEQDLAFALGVRIEQQVALAVRVRQALFRDHGVALDRRLLRLIAKLDGRPDPSPSSLPPPAVQSARPSQRPEPTLAPPPPPKPPAVQAARPSQRPEPTLAPAPAPKTPTLDRASLLPAVSRPPGPPRHRGPYTAAMAENDLTEANTRDGVLQAFLDFAAQYFEYAALFAVRRSVFQGRDARGPGAAGDQVRGVQIPLGLPSSLRAVSEAGTFRIGALAPEGADAELRRRLGRRAGGNVLLLPLRLRGRTVLVFYGDDGEQDVELSAVGDVLAFAELVPGALERVILRTKLGPDARPSVLPLRVPRNTPSPRALAEQRERRMAALAEAVLPESGVPHSSRTFEPAPPAPADWSGPRTLAQPILPVTQPPPGGASRQGDWQSAPGLGGSPFGPEPGTKPGVGSTPPAEAPSEPAPVRPLPSIPVGPPASLPVDGAPSAAVEAAPAPTLSDDDDAPPSSGPSSTPELEVGESDALDDLWEDAIYGELLPAEDELAEARPGEPEIVVELAQANPQAADAEPAGGDPVPGRSGAAPLAPESHSVSYSPRAPQPRQTSSEHRLPPVIVNIESDCAELIDALVNGDPAAADKLVALGENAVSHLASRFPGPIDVSSAQSSAEVLRPASECGPILNVLYRIGQSAVPYLVVRSGDADPVVRAWATRLLGELPSVDGAQAVARRLVDGDANVQRAALWSAARLQRHADARTALRNGLVDLAFSSHAEVRHAALHALAELCDPLSVPELIPLLTERKEVAASARWALVKITHKDFGADTERWLAWWRENAARHRIEWLIDALVDDNAEIRRAAGEELKLLTREYFGYYDDLPPRERVKAQSRYREWWEAKGKARFP